ncbi:hypothetical protein [Sphingomonas sp.]|jgi:hypothetical protein|uniref:hypothetical protein n=1 Tax=Sphingomonas sp. TaxID=28214 RepID=UPI002E3762F7|nr:hypothetical protein [Sphingomonas sp.]HEX4695076.1 hypothetical protein [Sphingomonas sp.]
MSPESIPNFAPLDSIRITDRVEIIRASSEEADVAEMIMRRWSWPGAKAKPVYNRPLPEGTLQVRQVR